MSSSAIIVASTTARTPHRIALSLSRGLFPLESRVLSKDLPRDYLEALYDGIQAAKQNQREPAVGQNQSAEVLPAIQFLCKKIRRQVSARIPYYSYCFTQRMTIIFGPPSPYGDYSGAAQLSDISHPKYHANSTNSVTSSCGDYDGVAHFSERFPKVS